MSQSEGILQPIEEDFVTVSFKAPKSLVLKIEEYMENPLPKVQTKAKLITLAITRFIEETQKTRDDIERSTREQFPGLFD